MSFRHFTIIGLSLLALLRCSNPGGTSDETGFSTAKIYTPAHKPAQSAKVSFFPITDTTLTPLHETYTDNNGVYSVKSVGNGEYNIIARQDSLICYQDSILIDNGKAVLSDDTLETGCTFEGKVVLQSGQDPRNAVVHVLGTPFYTNVDTSGSFTVSDMPSGIYNFMVTVSNLAGYVPTFFSKSVNCSNNASLNDTFPVIFTGIPSVTGLQLRYDTSTLVVHLSWNATNYSQFRTYIVSRYPTGQVNPVPDTSWVTLDTFFNDPMRFQPLPHRIYDSVYGYDTAVFAGAMLNNYEYRVSIQNKSLATGATFESSFLTADHPEAENHPFRRHGLVAFAKQPCTLRVFICLAYGATPAYAWDIGGNGTFATGTGTTKPFTIPDTFSIDYPCVVRVTASSGALYYDTVHIRVEHQWVKVGSGITDSVVKVVELNNSIFCLTMNGANAKHSLWRSSDGRSWTKLVDSLPFQPRDIVSYNGELWVDSDTITMWHSSDGLAWKKIDGDIYLRKTPQISDSAFSSLGNLFVFKGNLFIVTSDLPNDFICNRYFTQILPDTSLKIYSEQSIVFGKCDWIVVTADSFYARFTTSDMLYDREIITTGDMTKFTENKINYGMFDSTQTSGEYMFITDAVEYKNNICGFIDGNDDFYTDKTFQKLLGKGYFLSKGLTMWEHISDRPPAPDLPSNLVVSNGTLYSIGSNTYLFK